MKKMSILGIVFLLCVATPVLSSSIVTKSFDDANETNVTSDEKENNFALRVCVMAIPKIFLQGKFVFIKVICPKFLVDGYVDYDFNDGTYSTGNNFQKHKFFASGVYLVTVEFDTIFGIKATGSTRVIIL